MSFNNIRKPSIKTYTQNIQNNIVLLSDSYETIKKFEETYSGIYSITPLFISSKFSRAYVTLSNFEILGNFPELKITYNAKDCISFEKCNYCGDCYQVCPVNCIDLDLSINFDKCTFCDKCKDVCKESAIDVNMMLTSDASAPFIITDIKDVLDKYAEILGVFHIEDMDKVCALTGAFQISEVVEHDEEICQFNKRLKYGCERCLQECSHDALYVENGVIKVNHTLCRACGKCVAVCPTGAMQNNLMPDRMLSGLLNAENEDGKAVVVGIKDDLRKFSWSNKNHGEFLKIECDHRFFNTVNYLMFFAKGYSTLYLLGEEAINNNEIAFSNRLIDYLFKKRNFIKHSKDYKISSTDTGTPLKETFNSKSVTTRRRALSEILKFLYQKSGIKGVLIEEPYLNIFGEVLVDETKCSLCLSCVQHCKIGALSANSSEYSLHHNPSACIQCRICQEVCPEKAIKIQNGLLLSESFFETHILHKSEPVICLSCGKEFGVRSAHEKVMTKLKQKGFDDKKLSDLKYCDTCRVKIKFQEANND